MQMYRDIAMITLGALGVIAYQKYREPVMDKIDCMLDKACDCAEDKLEKMR